MATLTAATAVDYDILKQTVFQVTGLKASSIDQIGRDIMRRSFEITLEDKSVIICKLPGAHVPPYIISSEVATMHYIRDYAESIPIPRVLAYETDTSHPLGPFLLMDKTSGVPLDMVLHRMSPDEQDRVVAQIARSAVKLFRLRHGMDAIGSLYADSEDGYLVGPIVRPPFFADGRAQLKLERGPFKSTKEYLLACTQREIDCARTLISQDASLEYQRDLEDCRLQVDQSMLLLSDLIHRCKGLDEDDPELAPFCIDMHELGPKNIIVSEHDYTKIVSVTGWDYVSAKPLWQSGRLPRWLQTSMSDGDDGTKVRLAAIFRHVVMNEDGKGSLYLRAFDDEGSIRCSLHDLCDYNAFKDGFLLRPTLESIAATLPGEEDVEGLSAILDPDTVTGRVARITLLTSGSAGDAMSLAFSNMNRDQSRAHRKTASVPDSGFEEFKVQEN